MAYFPDSAFNRFTLMAAHTRGVGFAAGDEVMSIALADGPFRFSSDGSGYSTR